MSSVRRISLSDLRSERVKLVDLVEHYLQLVWTAEAASRFVGIGEKSVEQVVSYLPLSHIAAQVNKCNF